MHFTIAGVKKIVRSTKVFVIQRFVISRFHCILSIHPKKKSSRPPSTARLLYFFANLRRAGRYLAD